VSNEPTHRAEAALIGALLADHRRLDEVAFLTTREFLDPQHRAIFAALVDIRRSAPEVSGALLAERIADSLAGDGVTAAYLHGLALSAEPERAAVYARIVLEAALHRDVASWRERGISPVAEPDISPAPAVSDERLRMEEGVLADLIQHPELVSAVAPWLEPKVFISRECGEIYQAIIAVDGYGEPVDEVTLAWQLERSRAIGPERPTVAPSRISRLGALAASTGIALSLGRDLLADRVRAEADATSARSEAGSVGHRRVMTPVSKGPALDPSVSPTSTAAIEGPRLLP
jgi:hypothetical protein